jgi:hypothetical protein
MALPRTLCSLSNFFFLRELEGPKPLQRDLLKKTKSTNRVQHKKKQQNSSRAYRERGSGDKKKK